MVKPLRQKKTYVKIYNCVFSGFCFCCCRCCGRCAAYPDTHYDKRSDACKRVTIGIYNNFQKSPPPHKIYKYVVMKHENFLRDLNADTHYDTRRKLRQL